MRVVFVIHGYPMRFNAGSEVYTQSLAHALADRHEVHVFTRYEDTLAPEGVTLDEQDSEDQRVKLRLVNVPNSRDRYRREAVDARFAEFLEEVRPHVVLVGHLNHLSTSLVFEARRRGVPVLFTLHDYWLMCPRGQFLQMNPAAGDEVWSCCPGQENRRCAERCYARYFSGAPDEHEADVAYWSDWAARRMAHVREVASAVDLFVAPSRHMLRRFRDEFGLPEDRLVFLDYGFKTARLEGRERVPEKDFVFGYIGTHTPAKGIHVLLEAFAQVPGTPRLRIWGRPRGSDTDALTERARRLLNGAADRVEWLPEYRNQQIVSAVFERVDAIVVPSIWEENSPLVIHEAQQARVPVITADIGGMAEFVRDEVNGLTFRHRDAQSLARAMARLAGAPEHARSLGARGYLLGNGGDVLDMEDHVRDIEGLCARVLRDRRDRKTPTKDGPWRITFDTNPDDCNLRCVMCEEHSPHSNRQSARHAAGIPRRRMAIGLLERVLEDRQGSPLREVIPSTMGEPLLYPEFERVIDLCVQHGLLLNLTTNGTFPRLGARDWARRLVPVLSDVKVSWNGATPQTQERIMLGSSFPAMVENVRVLLDERDRFERLSRHRARVTFQLTFLEANTPEIPDIVRLAIQLGIDRVKGHHVWTHFPELEAQSMRRSPEAIARWNAAVRKAQAVARQERLPNGALVQLENFHELGSDATSDLAPGSECPFLGREAWVNAEGRFDPCCAPDLLRRELGSFGNLQSLPFDAIWSGVAYRHLVGIHPQHPLCLSCNMRRPKEVRP